MNRISLRFVAVVGVLELIAAGCGGSGSADGTTTSTATTSPPSAESTTSPAPTTSAITATTAPSATCTPAEPGSATTSDWVSFGFDDANSRHNRAETKINSGNVSCLEILWAIDDIGGVTGTPVVVDEVVYFGDWNGWLHAVEADTGDVVWEERVLNEYVISGITSNRPSVFAASALVTDSRLFIPDLDGFLHARDRDTGSAVGSVEVDDQRAAAIFSAPVLVGNMLIVGVSGNDSSLVSLQGSVVAVDADTGDEVWRLSTTDENSDVRTGVWTSAAVDRNLGLVFFGTGNSIGLPVGPLAKALMAIDYKTGEIVWHNVLNPDALSGADVAASPNLFTIDDHDVVGVGGKSGLFMVVDRRTGAEVWSVQLTDGAEFGAGVYSTAALGDGVIYVNSKPTDSTDSITFALDMNDGSTLWERPIPGPAFGSMTLANGVVFHGSVAGTIYALDASDGNVLWSDELPGNFGDGISIADGRLFVGYGFSNAFLAVNGGIVTFTLP